MKKKKTGAFARAFNKFSNTTTRITGSPAAFIFSILVVIIWAVTGPFFDYSETWQLVINTGTTIITFLMVFIIQHSQNKDTMALHLKLNELLSSNEKASNRLVSIEDLTEEELDAIKAFYHKLSEISKKEKDIFTTHSIDEKQLKASGKVK